MKTATKALVIKEQTIGESDRLITLLSSEHGLIRAFVRRAKLAKSRSASATSLFAYGDFSLYKGRDAYTVDDVTPIEVFFDLRKDIERLALAQYFAQLSFEIGAEEHPCICCARAANLCSILRLFLNSVQCASAAICLVFLLATIAALMKRSLCILMPWKAKYIAKIAQKRVRFPCPKRLLRQSGLYALRNRLKFFRFL